MAGADFHREALAYSQADQALFRIAITTEKFENLVNYYREEAQEKLAEGGDYGWVYFELDPSSINREAFLDMHHELFPAHLENLETTENALVEGDRLKSGIENLMEGFPEFGEELGRCRTVIWHSLQVERQFYWFEKQQKGYIDP